VAGAPHGLRSMRTDRNILEHQIKKGTLPRILTYAKQYRALLIVFLIAVVLDAVVSSVTPLLFAAIIDIGISTNTRAWLSVSRWWAQDSRSSTQFFHSSSAERLR